MNHQLQQMQNCRHILTKRIQLIGEVSCFCLGKILLGIVELPNDVKNFDYAVVLIFAAIFYLSAFIFKLCKEGKRLLRVIFLAYIKMFLIWIVAFLVIIFSYSLSHELGWNMVEIISLILCELLSSSTLIILCNWQFIQKMEFIAFVIVLSINIIALGIKTVIFIQYDMDSPHKDMVLLNLTTQIAFAIILLDAIDKSYSQNCSNRNVSDNLVEQELPRIQ